MKELSIEEKAKAYDIALEKARQLCSYPTSKPFISDLQDLFPELKENDGNEDEKIRNNIKKVIGWYRGVFTEKSLMPEEYQEIDAWLEKQCERKHQYKSRPRYVGEGELLGKKESTEFSEDENIRKPILDVEIPFGANDSELEDVTYYIPKGYHAEIEDNKVVIKKGEQKPAEWSEEDEMMIKFTLTHFRKEGAKEDSDIIKWLKSLRPQNWTKEDKERIYKLPSKIMYR